MAIFSFLFHFLIANTIRLKQERNTFNIHNILEGVKRNCNTKMFVCCLTLWQSLLKFLLDAKLLQYWIYRIISQGNISVHFLLAESFSYFFSQYTFNQRDPRTNQYKADLQTPRRKFLNIQLAAVGEAVKRNVSHKDLVGGQGGLKFFVTTWLERWASTYYCHQILDIYIVITWGKEIILVFFLFLFFFTICALDIVCW